MTPQIIRSIPVGLLASALLLSGPVRAQDAGIPAVCEQTPAPGDPSEAEAAAWLILCAGGVADPSLGDGAACAALGDAAWPESRRLSARFIEAVLFEEPWSSARRAPQVRLRCVEIDGALELSNRRLDEALSIERSRLSGPLRLVDASTERALSFQGSRLDGGLDADGLRAEADIFLRGARIDGPARFVGGRLRAVEAQGATFGGGLDLDQARLDGPLHLNGARSRGGLTLRAAHLLGGADLKDLALEGELAAARLRVDGPVLLDGAAIAGAASLRDATIAGDLSLSNAALRGPLDLRGLAARRTALQGAALGGATDLGGARVETVRFSAADGVATRFDPGATLSLRSTRIRALEAEPALWRAEAAPRLDLRGFSAKGGAYLEASAVELIAWLESGFPEGGSFAEERAAYRALAAALVDAGRPGAARDALYAERRRLIARGDLGWAEAAGARIWAAATGFGLRPERAVLWGVVLIVLGAALGAASPRLSRLGAARLFRLSAENALPWPEFSGERRRLYRAGPALAALFAAQRLAGAALALAALAAALLSPL